MDFSTFMSAGDNSSSRFFLARHLDSPIIADGLAEDIDEVRSGHPSTKTSKGLWHTLTRCLSGTDNMRKYQALGKTKERVITDLRLLTPVDLLQMVDTIVATHTSLDDEESVAASWVDAVNAVFSSPDKPVINRLTVSESAQRWLDREETLEQLWSSCQRNCASGRSVESTAAIRTCLGTHITIDRHKLIIHSGEAGLIHYGSFEMFLAMKDCCGVRGRSFLAAEYFYPGGRLEARIQSQITWQRTLIELLGNDGYEIAKQTESLSKAWMTSLTDDVFRHDGPFDKMLDKVRLKIAKITADDVVTRVKAENLLTAYTVLLEDCTLQETVELFGLQKLCMFPFIYSGRGGASAAKEALDQAYISHRHAQELRACWCSSFAAGYVTKNHRWPGLLFPDEQIGSTLHRWYTSNRQDITSRDFSLSDWDGVRFTQTLDFNYHDNYLDLIDDKAISYYRDEMRAYWDGASYASSDRRLLLEMLSREKISIKEICDLVARREIPLVWKIVSLYPKEKEMKVNARMFSMMVLEMRTFFTCLEANLAEEVFPFLKTQTMTKDKVSITRRFFHLTRPDASSVTVRVFFECDLSRWNLRWRDEAVRPIAEDLNDLFGTPGLFTYVHEFFSESVILVRTPRLRPNGIELMSPPASDLVWYNHKGGFEGIAQKLWSICTYAMIDRGMRDLPCSYILIGQGDNQVLSIEVARDESIPLEAQCKALSTQISSTLTRACKDVNQDLKPEECLESRTVITYSKNVYINGAEHFTSVKFAARLFAQTNNEIPSLSGDLAGLSSACIAAAEYNTTPIKLGALQSFFLTKELRLRLDPAAAEMETTHPSYIRRLARRLKNVCKLILFTPVHFGGFSVASPIDFLYRGGGDPTAKDWSWLCRGGAVLSEAGSCRLRAIKGDLFSPRADPRRLFETPYALPLTPMTSQRASADRLAEQFVVSQTRNQDVLALTTTAVEDYKIALMLQLLTISPCNPLLISEAYSSSACAEVDRLRRMFTSTQTVQTASRRGGLDSSATLLHMSGEEAMYRMQQLFDYPLTGVMPKGSASLAMAQLRSFRRLWRPCFEREGLPFEDIVGVESMAPALLPFSISPCPTMTSGVKIIVLPREDRAFTRGPFEPYLGAATQSTRTEHGYKIVGDSRPSKATDRLSQLIHTPGMSATVQETFRQISRHRSTIDPSRDELRTRQIGGTMHHRFVAARKEMGAYACGVGNLSTWCFFITDEITGVSGSTNDYAFMFQEAFVYALGVTNLLAEKNRRNLRYWELTLEVSSADLILVPDEYYDTPQVVELDPEPTWSSSRMIFDPTATLRALTGPVPEEHTYIESTLAALPRETVILESLRAVTNEALRTASSRGFSSRVNLDTPPRVNIDVAELSRLGARAVLLGAARSTVLSVCHRWLSQLISTEFTSGLSVGIRQLSAQFAVAITPALDYTVLVNDTSLDVSYLQAEYKGNREYITPSLLLEFHIQREAKKLLSTAPELFGPTVLLLSEPSGSASALLIARIGHALHYYANTSQRLAEVSDALYFSKMLTAFSYTREASRQRHILSALRKMRKAPNVSAALIRRLNWCLHNTYLFYVAADHRVSIRLARSLGRPSVQAPLEGAADLAEKIISTHEVRGRFDWQLPVDHVSFASFEKFVRLFGAPSSRYGLYYPIWASLLRRVNPRRVVLIGVGNGVAAAAALDVGAVSVLGCDVGTEYNLRALRRGFPPPAVATHSRRLCFRWADSTLTDVNTDYNLASTIEKNLGNDSADSELLLIDIRPYPTERSLLAAIEAIPVHVRYIVHLSSENKEAEELIRRLIHRYSLLEKIEIRVGLVVHSFLIMLPSPRSSLSNSLSNNNQSMTTLRSDQVICIRDSVVSSMYVVADALCAQLCGCSFSRNDLQSLTRDLRSECGRDDFSDRYVDWTPVVKRYEFATALLDPDLVYYRLADWLGNGMFYATVTADQTVRHRWSASDITRIVGPFAWLCGLSVKGMLKE
ncbi:large protein [Armillaria mellea negative strand RNA virus 2]|uniref:RNA-directed RNA polymerase n=1 Tax=Armillaria mellea negative strand RNA virus 2 TaxID=2803971 RepID=A0A8D9PD15_9MONO|nr:large protein [Armillaria mellea negative strand RNA virus 2]DAD54832.1 TPA_asm: large protein [Armillaria mellea negative strand RNA virus 2]